ncbi:MAG TPA: ATP synthase F0 subunit C [Blastocatellia bacterium]|nr:ATP synthase F0 subunit C [Blastocatellia bacterium]
MIRFKLFVMSALLTLLVVSTAMAQTGTAAGGGGTLDLRKLMPFAVGIAAFGGALGDGRAIAGACEGTARNPGAGGRIFTMLLLGLALIETLVLFTFLTLFLVG